MNRIKESFESDSKRKDELHKFELDQTRRKYELEIESLKREIDQQVKLSSLAEEIQKHSNKLFDISDKLDLQKKDEDHQRTGEVYKREQMLQEKERNLQKAIENFENEKRRLEFAHQELENERNLLRKEYKRLDDLQSNIKQLETEKQKDFLSEKRKIAKEKELFEKEKHQFHQEIDLKTKEYEKLIATFESEKQEIFNMNEKFQNNYKAKIKEVEEMRIKLTKQESDLLKRNNVLEKKEIELSKSLDIFNTKNERLRLEQQEFEKEAKRVFEIANEIQKESDFLNSFKRNFDLEKEKLNRKHLELDTYAKTLQNEKSHIDREKYDLKAKTKVIDNLRYEVVKDFEQNPQIFKKIDIIGREISSAQNSSNRQYTKDLEGNKTENRREYLFKDKENQKTLWNVIRREESQAAASQKENFNYKPFNAEAYMGYLKKVNETTAENQIYINNEKNSIMQKKM